MTAAGNFRVPDDLAELDQWLIWRRERETKVPYSVSGRRASSTDPATWCPFEEALAAWQARPRYWAGTGFVVPNQIRLSALISMTASMPRAM